MTFSLRPVTRADLPAFHTVMMAAGMDSRSSWNRTTVTDLERSLFGVGSGGFLAWAGAEAVGCVGFRPDGLDTLTLNKLATLPSARGQGIGAALVQAVEELAAERDYGRVLLAVSQFNLEVIPFYERLGYGQDSQAVYAHANLNSPKPVVLVKGVLNEMHLKRLAEQGHSLRSLIEVCKGVGYGPAGIAILFAKAFKIPIRYAHDIGGYAETKNPSFLKNLEEVPQINKYFGRNL